MIQITLSQSFKKQTTKAIVAIVFFILFYFILFGLALSLTVLCFYAGLSILSMRVNLLTIFLGLGVGSIGLLITIFLIKFLFKRNKTDLTAYTEVKRAEQPELFTFIDDIVKEVGTDFPKKVYLSPDVNASVFYNSSFWSMFLPIRKNLHIGLGLVNTITKDELKAILAHEFGHFSQRTMKVGSYVYNVNHIIHNLLYDNDSYGKLVQSWASVSVYITFFVMIAVRIVQAIQWLLQQMYGIVNKSYLALSREMEFHADEVAAHVTGYQPLKTSLLRMDLASKSLNSVLALYQSKSDAGIISENIFSEQRFVMHFLAEKEAIPIENGLPNVPQKELSTFQQSKLEITNQWASHPELEERILALEKTGIEKASINYEGAMNLFQNKVDLEKALTAKLFELAAEGKQQQLMDYSTFEVEFKKKYAQETFHPVFKGYYDYHSPVQFKTEEVQHINTTFEALYEEYYVNMAQELGTLRSDLAILEAIANKQTNIQSFDYEGKKYKAKEASRVVDTFKKLIEEKEATLKEHDKTIYRYFYEKASQSNLLGEFDAVTTHYLNFDTEFDKNVALSDTIVKELEFLHQELPHELIRQRIEDFRPTEKRLKVALQQFITRFQFSDELSATEIDRINDFIANHKAYFVGTEYKNDNLGLLFEMYHYLQHFNSRAYFLNKKRWLDVLLKIED